MHAHRHKHTHARVRTLGYFANMFMMVSRSWVSFISEESEGMVSWISPEGPTASPGVGVEGPLAFLRPLGAGEPSLSPAWVGVGGAAGSPGAGAATGTAGASAAPPCTHTHR